MKKKLKKIFIIVFASILIIGVGIYILYKNGVINFWGGNAQQNNVEKGQDEQTNAYNSYDDEILNELLTTDFLEEDNYSTLFASVSVRITEKGYSKEKDLLNVGIKYKLGDKFFVYGVITSSQHETKPDEQLKMTLNDQDYQYMYYLNNNIPHYRIYYACYEIKDNIHIGDLYNVESMEEIFNISFENIVNVENGSDDTTQDYMLSQSTLEATDKIDKYYNSISGSNNDDYINNNDYDYSNNNSNSENKKYIHNAVSGCILVHPSETSKSVNYKYKCEYCGEVGNYQYGCYPLSHGGTYKGSYTCSSCKKSNTAIITTVEQ